MQDAMRIVLLAGMAQLVSRLDDELLAEEPW
jgi:hypothetical protein